MASATDPTVPLPTVADTDDDDDDDDVSSSQPQSPAPPAQQTTDPRVPSAPSRSAAAPANPTLSSIRSSSATNTNASTGNTDGLGTGAAAGIGVGVALFVCLAAFGVWSFLRRHRKQMTMIRSTSRDSMDEEHANKTRKSEVYAYQAGGPAEVSGEGKSRRWSELESPPYVAEIGGNQVFRAELPGSTVPVAVAEKGANDRLFGDAPIDEIDEPEIMLEKSAIKKDERLFSDTPIGKGVDTLDAGPKAVERKS
ncbi:hypothetical protein N0V94_003728 [Neodidymelliopsis sp. IMI 364377]|nr:hypothetical protein N0V94_003728 [Neodidymelliopsis sp. IMI 364377]